jgi:hypothetical protein
MLTCISSNKISKRIIGTCTTGIWLFAECRRLCRVLFIGHSAKPTLPSATLGKVLIYRVRDTRHSPALGKDCFAESQTLGKEGSRQRVVSGRLQLMAVSLCRVPHIGHSAKDALPSAFSRHSAKYIFIFLFCLPNFLWYVPTLCRPIFIICGQL